MNSPIFSARLSLFLLTRRRRQGFSMLEVLVALLVSFAFLMGTMNAMVIAAVMQVKAERQSQALYWIQQDLETIRSSADSQPNDPSRCTSSFSTSYAGLLQQTLTASTATSATTTSTRPLVNRTYTMTRVTAGSNTAPQILTVTYTISNASDPNVLATLYSEIIPTQALSC